MQLLYLPGELVAMGDEYPPGNLRPLRFGSS
jgi:hypothetical protein